MAPLCLFAYFVLTYLLDSLLLQQKIRGKSWKLHPLLVKHGIAVSFDPLIYKQHLWK